MSDTDHTTKPARREVERLLDLLEDEEWAVEDYKAWVDPYDPLAVQITAEYQGEVGEGE